MGLILTGGNRAPLVLPTPAACFTNPSDRYHYPYNKDVIWRPMGSARVLASAAHPTTISLRKAAGTFQINWNNNFAYKRCRTTDADVLVTVTQRLGDPGGGVLPVTLRMPSGTWPGYTTNGDRPCFVYEAHVGKAHAFYRFQRTGETTAEAAGHYTPDLNGPGWGNPRSHPGATQIHTNAMYLTGWEWNPTAADAPPVQHCLALILGARPGTDLYGQLNGEIIWPAVARDNFWPLPANPDIGDIPYGALITVATPDEGGPTAAALGITDPRGVRLFETVRDYGFYACESGKQMQTRADNLTTGGDPGITSATISVLQTTMNKMNSSLRMVLNNAQAQTCSGGGLPIAPNCAHNA